MPKMTSMEAAVRILESEGIRHIFGIPGAGILPFYRALKDLGTINTWSPAMKKEPFIWRTATPELLEQSGYVRLHPVLAQVILSRVCILFVYCTGGFNSHIGHYRPEHKSPVRP